MIVVDFDDIVVKLFVTLKTRSLFNDFLVFKIDKKLVTTSENFKGGCISGPVMKILAFLMSFVALGYAVISDLNIINKIKLVPAVQLGFDLVTSASDHWNIVSLRFIDLDEPNQILLERFDSWLV